jgi:vancomycin permeability regulator SanA
VSVRVGTIPSERGRRQRENENGRGFPPARFKAALKRCASAAEHLQDKHDEGDDEQKVNEPLRRQCHDAEQPEDEKDQNNGPQHCPHLLFGLLARKVRAMGDAALARLRTVRSRVMRSLRWVHALGAFVAAALLVLLVIAVSIRVELLGHLYADAASAPTTAVALILGAEVYADGRPSPALANRLDVGIELLRLGRVKTLLMSGGNGTFEVGAMRAYVVARGVRADAILLDAAGERTLASCLQARDSFGLRRIIVVSQELHVARAAYTCRRLGIDADGVAAPEFTGDRLFIYLVRERVALVFAWLEVNIRVFAERS